MGTVSTMLTSMEVKDSISGCEKQDVALSESIIFYHYFGNGAVSWHWFTQYCILMRSKFPINLHKPQKKCSGVKSHRFRYHTSLFRAKYVQSHSVGGGFTEVKGSVCHTRRLFIFNHDFCSLSYEVRNVFTHSLNFTLWYLLFLGQ